MLSKYNFQSIYGILVPYKVLLNIAENNLLFKYLLYLARVQHIDEPHFLKDPSLSTLLPRSRIERKKSKAST